MRFKSSGYLLNLLGLLFLGGNCAFFFLQRPSSVHHSRERVCYSSFEYEYLPPNPDANPDETPSKLTSGYPKDTPAGLRGEAVRSALKSGRCIGWELSSDKHLSSGGILQVHGKGMRDFLNNKLTQNFSANSGFTTTTYQEACLLDGKGRVVDRLKVAVVDDETALILTSPGHSSQQLLERLDPFVFPLDQIEISNWDDAFVFSLASIQWKHIEKAIHESVLPKNKNFAFPSRADQCVVWDWDEEGTKVLLIPSIGMPSQVCVGFTFVFYGKGEQSRTTGQGVWQRLTGEANTEGPIGIGALEYETLRIQAGVPAFGQEIGKNVKTSPLELHWQETINMDKGCYLGQEGIASIIKNPRGPPRTLYAVVFEDDFNTYETQSRGDRSKLENLTTMPRPGDTLFALGSNEELSVGTLTSVGEAAGTGDRNTVALALIRRADSIMKQMKELDLEICRDDEDFADVDADSGMVQPPPLDPLDGLEVIVGGSFTTGKLKMIPSRALRKGRNIFDEKFVVEDYFDETPTVQDVVLNNVKKEDDLVRMEADIEKATEEAEAAAAEARRKVEKMEMLKQRAEEAMARRKQQQKKE